MLMSDVFLVDYRGLFFEEKKELFNEKRCVFLKNLVIRFLLLCGHGCSEVEKGFQEKSMLFRMVRSGGLVGPSVSAASVVGRGRRRRRRKQGRRRRKGKRVVSIGFPQFFRKGGKKSRGGTKTKRRKR